MYRYIKLARFSNCLLNDQCTILVLYFLLYLLIYFFLHLICGWKVSLSDCRYDKKKQSHDQKLSFYQFLAVKHFYQKLCQCWCSYLASRDVYTQMNNEHVHTEYTHIQINLFSVCNYKKDKFSCCRKLIRNSS